MELKAYTSVNAGKIYPTTYLLKITEEEVGTEVYQYLQAYKKNDEFPNLFELTPEVMVWLYLSGLLKGNQEEKTWRMEIFVYNKFIAFPHLTINSKSIIDVIDVKNNEILVPILDRTNYLNGIIQYNQELLNMYPQIFEKRIRFYETETGINRVRLNEINIDEIVKAPPTEIKGWGVISDNQELTDAELRSGNINLDEIKLEEVRPFEYDRDAKRLHIPTGIKPPSLNLIVQLMRGISKEYGVAVDRSETIAYNRRLLSITLDYQDKFMEKYKVWKSPREKKYSESHPHVIILRECGVNPESYPYKNKNNISFTKPVREDLLKKIKENPEMYNKGAYEILEEYNEFLEADTILSIGKSLFRAGRNEKMKDIDYRVDEETDRIIFSPKINLTRTGRMTTSGPNFQGFTQEMKSLITGRPGKKILSVDIKAQEVMILIYGIMENQALKELVLLNNDPYLSIAVIAGLCTEETYNSAIKDVVKVPVLSIMNGKSSANIISELPGWEEEAKTILDLIQKDPGYVRIVKEAHKGEKLSKNSHPQTITRKGLFGTELYSTDKSDLSGSRFTKILNANFQLTAAEILAYGLTCLILDLKEKKNIYNLTLNEMTPIMTIYDELIIEFDARYEEEVKELTNFYLCPQIRDWTELTGEMKIGDYYVPEYN